MSIVDTYKVSTVLYPVGSHVANASLGSVVTIAVPAGAVLVCLQAATQSIRLTLDGTNPVAASTGFLVAPGDPLYFPVRGGMSLKVLQEASGAAIQYQFLREQ